MEQITTELAIITLIPLLLLILWRINVKLLKTYHSPLLGKIEVFRKYNGEKVLNINNYPQGVSTEKESVKNSYWYSIAYQAVKFCQNRPNPRVLMLGLGANTISGLIAKMDPELHQTVVEFDAEIIQACRDFFDLEKIKKLTLIQADIYKLIDQKKAFGQKYDVIIVDIFTGNPPYISLKSNQPTFIEKLLRYLKNDGMMLFNRPAHTEHVREDGFALEQYLKTLFKETAVEDIKDPRGYRNHVITAINKK